MKLSRFNLESHSGHPLDTATQIIRAWLVTLALVMTWNSFISLGVLLGGWLRPIPFVVTALIALIWVWGVGKPNVSIICSSTIGVLSGLRGVEILFYGEQFTFDGRLTIASLWFLVTATSISFGVLAILVSARKEAEKEVRDP